MGQSATVLVGAVAVAIVILLATLLHWRRMRSARVLLQGLGATLVVAGLYVIGFLDLVYQWVRSAVSWARSMVFDITRWIGLGIGALGVLLFFLGMAFSPVSRAEAKQRRIARQQQAPQVEARGAAPASVGTRVARPARGAAKPAPALDDEDAEIEAILRGHGIQ